MANELMEVPDFVKRLAAKTERLFDDARSPGRAMPPSIGIAGNKFWLKSDGDERPAPNQLELAFVVVAIKKPLSRGYYDGPYDRANPAPPICYSLDGVKPEPDAADPQSEACKLCKRAEWGSKVDERGKETTACRQHKQIVIKLPGVEGLWLLSIPVASIKKQWDVYANGIEEAGRVEKAKYGFSTLTLSTCVSAAMMDTGIMSFKALGYVGNPKLFSTKDCEELEAAIDSAAIPTMLWGPQGVEREKQYLAGTPTKLALPKEEAAYKAIATPTQVNYVKSAPEKKSALPWNDDGYEPPGEVVEIGEEKPRARGRKTSVPPIVTKIEQDTKSSSILKDLGLDGLDL